MGGIQIPDTCNNVYEIVKVNCNKLIMNNDDKAPFLPQQKISALIHGRVYILIIFIVNQFVMLLRKKFKYPKRFI